MTVQADVLDLFNALVVPSHRKINTYSTELISQGVVTDFIPSAEARATLHSILKPLDMRTLFTVEERMEASLTDLLVKQFLHYIEVYDLNTPGLFNLEVDTGKLVSLRFVQGITEDELAYKVSCLLYDNTPIKDTAQLKRIIDHYNLTFEINSVANNELRILLWSPWRGTFLNGDDAVRWLCYNATGSSLLIKSREVINAVSKAKVSADFFEAHTVPLAQVFNRHKKLILAAKNKANATAINRIARLSKTAHVPVRESIAKTFVHKALIGEVGADVLDKVSTRDKFKYLNLLAEKKLRRDFGLYRVRNGKVFVKTEGMNRYPIDRIAAVEEMVLASLAEDLRYLRGWNILLDPAMDYGLPVSRKQTLGRLPYGTSVWVNGSDEISAGIYWENAWGAHDLDLSAVTKTGERTGWGNVRGYLAEDVVFSGDITDARNGAMEFMTSKDKDYGLIVNIYAGRAGSEMELVVGSRSSKRKQWMDETIIRERHVLDSRNCLIGFVRGREFVVFAGRMDSRRVSGMNPTLQAMDTDFWTVGALLERIGVSFDVDNDGETEYDADLSYEKFSYDKLEEMFFRTA